MPISAKTLARVKDRASLYAFLNKTLNWPLDEEDDFAYDRAELPGATLKQIVPFTSGDPYLVLLLETPHEFRKSTARAAAREIRRLKREGMAFVGKEITDMVFVCAAQDYAEVKFVKFVDRGSRQPKLASFGWSPATVAARRNNTMRDKNLPMLELPTVDDVPQWDKAKWSRAWDTEPVTKAFYEAFETHRLAFLKHLPKEFATEKRHWMTSLTLNRLMFAWFLADGNRIPKLKEEMVAALDRDEFYGGYFLPLCLCALGRRKGERGRWEEAFAHIPYLNGGLFERHRIEEELGVTLDGEPGQTDFPVELFRNLLREPTDGDEGGLFRRFNWTLDEQGEEATSLSPHVLGYVFERHINGLDPEQEGQKKNGAYYTKEDITGYIARSTIIPRLFDKLDERKPGRASFNLAHLSPEGTMRYVFPSVKQTGLLPTETPYELKRRRVRVEELRRANPTTADEFVTINLNLSLLAEDFVSETRDPETLWAFYEGLRELTVLDPTVGSGAFLLAALEVLAPIHRACLVRMAQIVKEAYRESPVANLAGAFNFEELIGQGTLSEVEDSPAVEEMRKTLRDLKEHIGHGVQDDELAKRAEAYVRKGIVLDNLFGVDLMPEAVEICRLRLYLALLSGGGGELEPLPDLEFNIVPGNALVGFSSLDDVTRQEAAATGAGGNFDFEDLPRELGDVLREIGNKQRMWRAQTMGHPVGRPITKDELRDDARDVKEDLDERLWHIYRTRDLLKARTTQEGFQATHRPLHWPLAFPSVFACGGFDCIIGNPPYLEKRLLTSYRTLPIVTEDCPDIYSWVVERAVSLSCHRGIVGLIVPISISSSGAFRPARAVVASGSPTIWTSHFSNRPSQLFEGAQNRLTILLHRKEGTGRTYSTGYYRWDAKAGEREALISGLSYADVTPLIPEPGAAIPKVFPGAGLTTFEKLELDAERLATNAAGHSPVYWIRVPGYFCQFFLSAPTALDTRTNVRRPRGELMSIGLRSEQDASVTFAALNSSVFLVHYFSSSDGRHINPHNVSDFPLDVRRLEPSVRADLERLSASLNEAIQSNIRPWRKSGLEIDSLDSRALTPIINEIDRVLARHYELSEEELAFVLNYDLKYRLGRDASVEESKENQES